MSSQEEYKLLEMLRKKFQRYGKKYGSAVFSMEQLEHRIKIFITGEGDIQKFLINEMEFMNKVIEKAKSKIEERNPDSQKKFAINRIIEKNEKKMRQYNDSFFDPQASYEMRYLIGAISEFYSRFFVTVRYIFRGTHEWMSLSNLFCDLERFYFIKGESSQAPLLKKYIEELAMGKTPTQKDIVDTRYLQTGGSHLYNIQVTLERLLAGFSESMRKQNLPPEYEVSEWKNQRYEIFLERVIGFSKNILQDFRLTKLVSYNK